jgi:peptide deformylase
VLYSDNKRALRKKSKPVRHINRPIKALIRDLKATLRAHPEGIGLAAPQINIHRQVVVVRLGSRSDGKREPDPPIALINPKIIEAGHEKRDFDGCLSFPDLYGETVRPHFLRITGLDEWGNFFEQFLGDFDAVLVHHEIDHLEGVLFIDRLESLADLYWVRTDEKGRLVRVPVSIPGGL